MPLLAANADPIPLAGLVVGVVAALGGVAAAFFAWRGWISGRRKVEIDLRVQTDQSNPAAMEWGLLITAKCRRGSAWVASLSLAGPQGALAWPPETTAGVHQDGVMITEGSAVFHFVPKDEFVYLHTATPGLRACWQDAEDKHHCREIEKHLRDRLLSDRPGESRYTPSRWERVRHFARRLRA